MISYFSANAGDLRLAHCNTSTCASGFEVTVALTGGGTGAVTSAPVPINCPGVCTGGYANGTSVVLTAVAVAGSTFSGWTGCDSNPTAETCALNVTADVAITAGFTADPPPPTPTTTVPPSKSTTTPGAASGADPSSQSGLLASTGASILGAVAVGLTLVAVGGLAVRARRRLRH